MIRVLIADDHAMLRDGLAQLLGTVVDFEVVGAARNGAEAVRLSDEQRPEVILMDLEMPEMDGIAATREIMATRPETRIVVLTSFSDRQRILDALDAGAVGYLLKDAEPEEIVRGVRAAADGQSPLAARAAHTLIAERVNARPAAELTARELDVLRLVADGLPNKLIARRLEISEKTVKAHLTSTFQRIGVTDRTQAALWAKRNRIA
jgi:DNA-binding NarL/FixJ family response regulator